MYNFIRITSTKTIKEGRTKYSFIRHLKIVLRNFRCLFTRELLTGNDSTVTTGRQIEVLHDAILRFKDGTPVWEDATKEDTHDIGIAITVGDTDLHRGEVGATEQTRSAITEILKSLV